jgi:hypothetical protein
VESRRGRTRPAPLVRGEDGSAITSRSDHAEQRLREALAARASRVRPATPPYRQVSASWRRRERKRRLILAILTAAVFTAADAVGLWALNHANTESHVIFSDPTGGRGAINRISQP